jgi:poly(A) polymerase
MNGYHIDLLYATMDFVPVNIEKSLKEESFFNKLNLVSQNSLNGLLTCLNLTRSVPDQTKFRNTLKIIKFWAMRRCIYSHTLGYLGGISYAIMVAKIC